MIDSLIQKLEEKVMTLIVELDDMRKEVGRVKQENALLRSGRDDQRQKLQSLIALLDTTDSQANERSSRQQMDELMEA